MMNRNTKNEWQHKGAFVVQFRPETDLMAGRCAGRVEHVATYECARFHSLNELLTFLARILGEAQTGGNDQEKEQS